MSESTGSGSEYVLDATQESFESDVFQRSKTVPVIVDFWAEWCGPCRTLGPILQGLAEQYAGRFVLVKADTEQLVAAATEFNVQSIPAVYAVIHEEVVDFFQGALPEEQLKAWIDRVLLHADVLHTADLEESDPAAAESKYRQIAATDEDNVVARIGLARVLVKQEKRDEARQIIEALERRGFLEPEAEAVKAALELQSFDGGSLDEATAAAEAKPDDLNLQLQLAEALAANQDYRQAMDVCLAIVERDKVDVGDKARAVMVDIFRVLSDEDLVRQYRRKLSSLLY